MSRRIFAFTAAVAALALTLACGSTSGQNGAPEARQPSPAAPAGGADGGVKYTATDGSSFTVTELPGEVKVINYWATWCAPCIKEIPSFNQLHAKYADKGVTVVGVSIDEEGASVVEPFLKTPRGKIDYRIAYAKIDDLGPVGVTTSIPVTLVYDKSGRLVKRFDGYAEEKELEESVQAALGGSAS
jgi:thiol-disulfide isomerase/thioredoxin